MADGYSRLYRDAQSPRSINPREDAAREESQKREFLTRYFMEVTGVKPSVVEFNRVGVLLPHGYLKVRAATESGWLLDHHPLEGEIYPHRVITDGELKNIVNPKP